MLMAVCVAAVLLFLIAWREETRRARRFERVERR